MITRVLKSTLPAALMLVPCLLMAAERRDPPIKKGPYNPEHETVEMFAAMESGEVTVEVIAKSSKEARVFIRNKTDRPLNVKLPEAFVGVLAQFDGGFGDDAGGFGDGGANQQFGGGFGGLGGLGGGGLGGGQFFNVPAERVGQMDVACVCLEHGKADPKPRIKYVLKPVEAFSNDPALKELLTLMGSGRYSQRAAQVAAWNIASGMSWQQLAAKRVRRLGGFTEPYFTPRELLAGKHMADSAHHLAQQRRDATPERSLSER